MTVKKEFSLSKEFDRIADMAMDGRFRLSSKRYPTPLALALGISRRALRIAKFCKNKNPR